MHAYLMSLLAAVCVCLASGCATDKYESHNDINGSNGYEQPVAAESTDDSPTVKDIVEAPVWMLLGIVYGLGESDYEFQP